MSESLAEEIIKLKSQLETFKLNIDENAANFSSNQLKWQAIDKISSQIHQNKNTVNKDILRLNVGGEEFRINLSLLDREYNKDCLLTHLVKELGTEEEIFIDRDSNYFPLILDCLNGYEIDYFQKFSDLQEFNLFRRELEFYNISKELKIIESKLRSVEFVNAYFQPYYSKNTIVGSLLVEDILNPDCQNGLCSSSPGNILIELSDEFEIDKIDISGYRGDANRWYSGNGQGAKISVSLDNITFVDVGKIPHDFALEIKRIQFYKIKCRYIQFSCTSHLGIGYLKVFNANFLKSKTN